jgi:hypothetical protein
VIRCLLDFFSARDYDLLQIATDYRAVVHEQQDLIQRKDEEILRLKLEYTRWGRSVIENFLLALETPEVDMREVLWQAVADMNDEVARLEEHITA